MHTDQLNEQGLATMLLALKYSRMASSSGLRAHTKLLAPHTVVDDAVGDRYGVSVAEAVVDAVHDAVVGTGVPVGVDVGVPLAP